MMSAEQELGGGTAGGRIPRPWWPGDLSHPEEEQNEQASKSQKRNTTTTATKAKPGLP